jgi:UDPglucose--hexose-1-phosphate uridylyltransferase
VCYTPAHNLTLAELPVAEIAALLDVWRDQYLELGSRPDINHVLTFENKGDVVGVSNPHPHGQIYATNFVFKTIETEAAASRRYYDEHRRVLFQDILRSEQADGRRLLHDNGSAVAFLPYFARYAYECYVAPKATHASLATMSVTERRDLAAALKSLLVRYDNLWQMSFPYVLTLHQAPTDGADHSGFHFHIECHPPLRKPHLLKYLAGPETGGGNFLSDTRPEAKAAELLATSAVHYLEHAPPSHA